MSQEAMKCTRSSVQQMLTAVCTSASKLLVTSLVLGKDEISKSVELLRRTKKFRTKETIHEISII